MAHASVPLGFRGAEEGIEVARTDGIDVGGRRSPEILEIESARSRLLGPGGSVEVQDPVASSPTERVPGDEDVLVGRPPEHSKSELVRRARRPPVGTVESQDFV
jgi:hypothetical protein